MNSIENIVHCPVCDHPGIHAHVGTREENNGRCAGCPTCQEEELQDRSTNA
jgi:ssDNA-binding Zn-finger/Zn-ribbon topoisomerase 1